MLRHIILLPDLFMNVHKCVPLLYKSARGLPVPPPHVTVYGQNNSICRLLEFPTNLPSYVRICTIKIWLAPEVIFPSTSNYMPQISLNVTEVKIGRKGEVHIITQITTTPLIDWLKRSPLAPSKMLLHPLQGQPASKAFPCQRSLLWVFHTLVLKLLSFPSLSPLSLRNLVF